MNRVLAELRSAERALVEATEALRRERQARRLWVLVTALAIAALSVLAIATWANTQDVRRQAEQQILAECESRNDTRLAIRGVLEFLVGPNSQRSPERRAEFDQLFSELDSGVLEIQACDG